MSSQTKKIREKQIRENGYQSDMIIAIYAY